MNFNQTAIAIIKQSEEIAKELKALAQTRKMLEKRVQNIKNERLYHLSQLTRVAKTVF